MSTRQLRITQTDQIQKKVTDLVGKKINVILSDKTAMFGELHAVQNKGIVLKNMRLKKMHFPFTQISEVYFDSID